jgi:hypothetical protein
MGEHRRVVAPGRGAHAHRSDERLREEQEARMGEHRRVVAPGRGAHAHRSDERLREEQEAE